MHIRVLLFGPAALAQGDGDVQLDIGDSTPQSARAVLDALADTYEKLAPFTKNGRLAVNGAYTTGEFSLGPDDEIALIAMVSGG